MNALYTNYQVISLSSSTCKFGRHITTFTISHDICNTLCNCMKLSYKLNAKIEISQTHTCCYFSKISGPLVVYFSHQAKSGERPRNKAGKRVDKTGKIGILFNFI